MNLPAQKARKCWTTAAIRNVTHVDLGARFQEFAFKMWKRANPCRAIP